MQHTPDTESLLFSANEAKNQLDLHTKKMIFQGAVRHEFIYQYSLLAITTIPFQIHEVRVVKKTQQQNLHKELSVTLKAIPVKLFDSNILNVMKIQEVSACLLLLNKK